MNIKDFCDLPKGGHSSKVPSLQDPPVYWQREERQFAEWVLK